MKTFLVVKVLDVNYNPHKAQLVEVLFGGTTTPRQPLTPTGSTGVFEIEIPAGITDLQIGVEEPGFFPVGQELRLKPGPPTPSLTFTGAGQAINVRNLDGHTRGSDFNVEVFVVIGQLQDTRHNLDAVKLANPAKIRFLDPVNWPVLDFSGLTVLDPGGRGWHQFIHAPIAVVAPVGKMLYVERTTIPKLIAIWVPDGLTKTRERNSVNPEKVPLHFHLFYHPSPSVLDGPYPFGVKYVDLICRYLFEWKVLHKQMTNQHQASGAKPIFVFPVGDKQKWNGTLGSQTSILRLLQEIAYFVQRKDKIPFPLQKVGKCAVSGFSAGGIFVQRALGADNAFFHDQVLTEIYGFDLRTSTTTFASLLAKWFRGGAGERRYRIYTTDSRWLDAAKGIDPRATTTKGKGGAVEHTGPQTTVMFTPVDGFWTSLDPLTPPDVTKYQVFRPNFTEVHQIFPAIFMQHALKNSRFSSP